MKPYKGRWLDCFTVSIYNSNERPQSKGKVMLETPNADYFFTREQWREFKAKVNEV